ncbi:MAG: undecaprenyldiphospho-muramoylpentapeptide beta-N-acetylglucosaminyltransferase [Myxococcota bacterium]
MLIAGGGTGGHLYPGIALAEELTTRQKGNEVVFVGTERGLEARVVPALGFPLDLIEVKPLKGRGIFGVLAGLLALPRAVSRSAALLKKHKPDVAVGVGGYASGPVLLAAWMARIPAVVLEQNTVPGFTNRVLSRLVDLVFTSFESSARWFPKNKAIALGNPIRQKLLDNFLSSKVPDGKFNVLVLGGSQGAHALNLRMLEAAPSLLDLGEKLRIIHQTGQNDEAIVKKGYAEAGLDAEVHAFIEDMSAVYRRADLVVCRAGATTIAELLVAKKAALFVPYPFAADNHQELNAKEMVERGAAMMILERELDGRRLADEIRALFGDRARLEQMERAASRAGRPEAGREIIDACVDLVRRRGGGGGQAVTS